MRAQDNLRIIRLANDNFAKLDTFKTGREYEKEHCGIRSNSRQGPSDYAIYEELTSTTAPRRRHCEVGRGD